MPTQEANFKHWNDDFDWPSEGDAWSKTWGGAASQWYGTLLPRLRSFVPAGRILEIAPGFGRWTQFLLPLAGHMTVVDLSPKCIAACKHRFADASNITYHVNDGLSLDMVPDSTIDFVFSFDSLVHVEADILLGYLSQIARKLTPHGVAFLHHSNLGEFVDPATGMLPAGMDNRHWRATSTSGAMVQQHSVGVGLRCVSQEVINWGKHLTDAITVLAKEGSRWDRDCVVLRNPDFIREALYLASLAQLYELTPSGSDDNVRLA